MKTWKEKLKNKAERMPEIKDISCEKMIAKTGPGKMQIPAPLELDSLMRAVPEGKLITTSQLQNYLNEKYGTVYTCPMCIGIFTKIAAFAAEEEIETKTGKGYAWWRTLKNNGELNDKFPGGIQRQAEMLSAEGHTIVKKGKKTIVENFSSSLYYL